MFELRDGLILYHGSYCEVKAPELAKCSKKKDFGQGFYLTTSEGQAKSFLKTSIVKAETAGDIQKGQEFGYVSKFEVSLLKDLKIRVFENADADWLHCIAAHRKYQLFADIKQEMARFDIIAGKIADDATNATLVAYLGGAFGMIGERAADDFCIKQLLPDKLKDQYCFKTDQALACLTFVGSEKVWIR
ncbi:DUF3990 domain-containing protein [Lachnospiraceae bacterium HCP1S3_A8]|nr:DUF3990 domain-containing protein [Lachnospiraceae bacterium]